MNITDGLVIVENVEQSIDESTSGCETTKSYDVYVKDGGMKTTDSAYRSFGAWILANRPYDSYGNSPQKVQFQTDTKSIGNHWTAQVTWGPPESSNKKSELEKYNIKYNERFSTKGGKKTRKTAFAQYRSYNGIWVDDWTLAIGERGTGVEVDSPAMSFQISDRFPYSWMTAERKMMLALMTGQTVNNDTFLGYNAGMVRFLGCDASLQQEYEGEWGEIDGVLYQVPTFYWDVTFDFAAQGQQEIQTNDGSVILPPWYHLWTDTEEVDEDVDGETQSVTKISNYHASQIYQPFDYSALGL